jgi:paraquat-inducible protein B
MSSTDLLSDKCAKSVADRNNDTTFNYVVDKMQYEHKKSNKIAYNAKNMSGNVMQEKKRDLVDIESRLRGQTKKLSRCSR